AVQGLSLPGHGPSPRRLAPLQPSGTWLLEGDAVLVLWSLTAGGWIDQNHLRGDDADLGLGLRMIEWTLDLRTGRSARGADDRSHDEDQGFQYATSQEGYRPEPEVGRTLASALEELPLDAGGHWGH